MIRKHLGLMTSTAIIALGLGGVMLYSNDNQADLLYHPDTIGFDALNASDIDTIESIQLGLQQARQNRTDTAGKSPNES